MKMANNFANLNMEVNEDLVKTIFKQSLNQSVIEAMGNKEDYLSALINQAFNQKVDSNGDISRYNRDNQYSWLDVVVNKTIQTAAKEAIDEYLVDNKELLKIAVKEEMEKEENKSALVNSFVKGATEAFDYRYNFRADIKIVKSDDY